MSRAKNFRRAETDLPEMLGDADERRDGIRHLRGVHQDGGLPFRAQAEIFPRRGVAGERFAGGGFPVREAGKCARLGHGQA